MRVVRARVPVAAWFLPASATAGASKAAYDWHIADAFLEVAV
jgi:hypothetical protein